MDNRLLFSPIAIGGCELKNRIAMAPMHMGMGTFDGTITPKMADYYLARAKGGTGLIIMEITRINDKTGATAFAQPGLSHDYQIGPLREFCEKIHKYGSKLFVQLHHPGRQNIGLMVGTIPICISLSKSLENFTRLLYKLAPTVGKKLIEKQWLPAAVAPSKVEPSYFTGGKIRALSLKEVEQIITQFVDGAERAQKAGCDGIVLHAAHGYLIQQFLSPNTNHREDEYGGEALENRMRFLINIIKGIRKRCRDFPIIVRLSVDECYDQIGEPNKGYGLEEGVEMAVALEAAGIDAIDVSCAAYDTFNYWLEPGSFEPGWRAYMAKAVKERVKIPVIAANLIRSVAQAEEQLINGTQDILSLGRPHIADPKWTKKVYSAQEHTVKRCINCLFCFETMQHNAYQGKSGRCAINPFVGREKHKLIINGAGRKVVIIGAGPAGLMAAEILARRGFRVVVYEKRNRVGGQVSIAANSPEKSKLAWCIDDLKFAAEKKGVKFILNKSCTASEVDDQRPYAVIVATGSEPIIPDVEGITHMSVCTAHDVYQSRVYFVKKSIAVIGSGLTGLETAYLLAKMDNAITVVEKADTIAAGVWMQHVDDVLPKLKAKNAVFLTGKSLSAVDDTGVVLEDSKTHQKMHLDVDNVVLAIGMRPESSLFQQLRGRNANVFLIGDALKPGRIGNATEDAFKVAFNLGLDQNPELKLTDD
ncbi:MAG: NAD(P)/FAD-dependent oxidoreductase [Christensenellaceae bacterium]|jgi:2,4-dienoyl-CoA reductase-like NADH-dependent reductase (Old Yellow Enzyme family)/thioredoxin reductase|nr:NAD(P)/FAD-dependent oxidoreductase [Christensenellaceae bacterium]